MLISDDVLFLHVPKTGGLSITDFLLNNLKGSLAFSRGLNADPSKVKRYGFDDVAERVTTFRGRRHETMKQAIEILEAQGRTLSDFKCIIAVIRNPYDLEVSHYEHMRKPHVVKRRGAHAQPVKAAAGGDFGHFVAHAPFFGNLPPQIEQYYTLKGQTPENLHKVRFETMTETIPDLIAPFSHNRWPFPHFNVSKDRRPYRDYLTPEIEAAIFEKYRFLFDYYPRETVAAASA